MTASQLGVTPRRARATSAAAPTRAAVAAGALVILNLAFGGCRDTVSLPRTTRCETEPVGTVIAFLPEPDEIGSFHLAGTVSSLATQSAQGLSKLVIHDEQGADHLLSYLIPGETLPVRQGGSYRFQIEHAGRFPAASALLVWDTQGLLFAGVSDIGVGQLVLAGGIEGFSFELLPPTCESRSTSECDSALRNTPLRAAHGGSSTDLFNGESADLGGYRVACLTAQQVVPSSRCSEAGRLVVSYTIRRTDASP